MTPALSYAPCYGLTFEAFLEEAAARGVSAVELIPDQTPNLLQELTTGRRDTIRKKLVSTSIVPIVHSVFYDINLVSLVPDVQSFALKVIGDCAAFAQNIGARELIVHPGYRFPGWRSSEFQRQNADDAVQRGIAKLSILAENTDMSVFLENGSYFLTDKEAATIRPLHFGVTLDEIETLFEQASNRLGICLDYGKAKVSGLPIDVLTGRLHNRSFRFQVGSATRLEELLSEIGTNSVLHDPRQITYEGPLSGLEELLRIGIPFVRSAL